MPGALDDGLYTWSRGPVNNFKKGLHNTGRYNDPTYLGFVLLFDWYTPETQTWHGGSPLLAGGVEESTAGKDPSGWSTKPGTAMDYLKRCGEFTRMKYLNAFISTLKTVNYQMPWYWQEVEGLEVAWQNHDFKDPYKGGDEAVVKLKALESVDMIMTRLMALYNKAVYDKTHRRIIIPENLRKFTLYICVQEIRKFQLDKLFSEELKEGFSQLPGNASDSVANKFNSLTGTGPNDNPNAVDKFNKFFQGENKGDFEVINERSPKVVFQFEYCEFMPDESNVPFSALTMHMPNMAEQLIAFKWENLKVDAEFPFVEYDLANQSGNVGANAESNWKDKLDATGRKMAANAIRSGTGKLKGYLNSLILGNVHGFSAGSIDAALQQGTIQGLSQEIGQTASVFFNQNNDLTGDENVNPQNPPTDNSLPGDENIHNP